ncbi:MAG: DCC1-like thiol-disulfide oxidoreductase family protein [Acidimicrobiia bacterium]
MTRPIFLYDGDCAFCTSCARFIERHVRTEAEITPWQWADLSALGVEQREVEEVVLWVEPGLVVAGPDAIAVLLRRAQWYWRPLGWLGSLTPVSWLAWPVYRLIARHRHRFPGGTPACSLPQSERDESGE